MHVELLSVGLPVCIPEAHVDISWLRCIGVQDEVIGAGLVAEALAIEIDFQPGLASHPEYHGSTTVGASQGVGGNACSVEKHARVCFVHFCPNAKARLYAVSLTARLR